MSHPLKLGYVDLDTSHPGSFLPIIRRLGYEVAGVYDSGAVYPNGYAQEFAERHEIGRVFDRLDEMADAVDAVFIFSCNWDVHVERARPFVEAGKAVFIDKPIAGNMPDLLQLKQWIGDGARLTGGSSLRFADEAVHWRDSLSADDRAVYALVGCGVDEFNYGIHAFSLLHGIYGPGIKSVRHIGAGIQEQVELVWADGRKGMISIGQTREYLPFHATIVTERDVSHFRVDHARLYDPLVEKVLPYMAGEAEEPMRFDLLIEAEMAAVAAKVSLMRGGESVRLDRLHSETFAYNGAEFEKAYREMKLQALGNK